MLSQDFLDFIRYIVSRYKHANKIVEVGIGKFQGVAVKIKEALTGAEVIVIDNNPDVIAEVKSRYPALKAFLDDVREPNARLYENADLIYSIRPPFELWSYLIKLADISCSTLIIKPLLNELPSIPSGFKLVSFGSVSFLLRKICH